MMRVHFSDYNLGRGSSVVLTSMKDQRSQRLEAGSMAEWNRTSAIFNGNTVKVELHAAPGESDIFVKVDQLIDYSSEMQPITSSPSLVGPELQSLCGADGRVASSDNRVGRINGCTGWLASNGAVLTSASTASPSPSPNYPIGITPEG